VGSDVLDGVVPLMPRRLQERYVRLHALSMLSGEAITVRYAPHDFKCHAVLTRWIAPFEAEPSAGNARAAAGSAAP
jgi:hypothetical protein